MVSSVHDDKPIHAQHRGGASGLYAIHLCIGIATTGKLPEAQKALKTAIANLEASYSKDQDLCKVCEIG